MLSQNHALPTSGADTESETGDARRTHVVAFLERGENARSLDPAAAQVTFVQAKSKVTASLDLLFPKTKLIETIKSSGCLQEPFRLLHHNQVLAIGPRIDRFRRFITHIRYAFASKRASPCQGHHCCPGRSNVSKPIPQCVSPTTDLNRTITDPFDFYP